MCSKPFHSSSQENLVSIADDIIYGSRDMGNKTIINIGFVLKSS